jgi:hypothetical protein
MNGKSYLKRSLTVTLLVGIIFAGLTAFTACKEKEDTKNKSVAINYEKDTLTVSCEDEKVIVDQEGLHISSAEGTVDLSLDGIHVNDGSNTVDIGTDGINIEGDEGNVNIDLPGVSGTILGEQKGIDYWNCNQSLLKHEITVSGETINIGITLKDGYLVTKNCSEEYTKISGVKLEKTESDEDGNIYRFYTKK